jgi:hypothetical protein
MEVYTRSTLNKQVMGKERDEESGKFVKQYPEEEFLDTIEELETPTTKRVAEGVGCSYDLAYRRLNSLEGKEVVSSDSIGGSLLWSIE